MKTKAIFLAIALVAMTGGLVSAQKTTQPKTQNTTQQGFNFVDVDKNGKCDNFEKGNGGNNPKGDGVRLKDGSGRTSGKGKGLGRGQGPRDGRGQGLRDGTGNGGRRTNVDANKNGVDNNSVKK